MIPRSDLGIRYTVPMGRRTSFAPDEIYHLYNRGTEKRRIFMDAADYKRFAALLYLCNQRKPINVKAQGRTSDKLYASRKGEPLIDIAAYCLMPNHFHIIAREREYGGISKFMQKLLTAYTMYFNTKQKRTGTLFQGRFKATHAEDDRYLRYLIAYVHLNPVKLIESKWKENGISDRVRAEKYLYQYKYSSYLDNLGIRRPENAIVQISALPKYFTRPTDFSAHVSFWIHNAAN
jgi:putative transposase